jgi:hypothetical protein
MKSINGSRDNLSIRKIARFCHLKPLDSNFGEVAVWENRADVRRHGTSVVTVVADGTFSFRNRPNGEYSSALCCLDSNGHIDRIRQIVWIIRRVPGKR